MLRILNNENSTMMERTWVLNSVDAVDFDSPAIDKWIRDFYNSKNEELKGAKMYDNYLLRCVEWYVQKGE